MIAVASHQEEEKLRLWCCRYQQRLAYYWGENNTFTDRRRPTYHWRPQIIQENLDSRFKTQHNEHIRRRGREKISNGQGSLGHWHLLQLPRSLNSLLLLLLLLLFCLFVCFLPSTSLWAWTVVTVSSFWRHAHCFVYKNKCVSRANNEHRPVAVSVAIGSSSMRRNSRTYGLFSKSG